MQELWLPVRGYEGLYEVSDLGRVRSLDRVITQGCPWGKKISYKRKGRILTLVNRNDRYLMVALSRRNKVRVHVLVAEAFLPPCPGPRGRTRGCWEIDHINDESHDNRAVNLQWLPKRVNGYAKTDRTRNARGQFV